MMWRRRFGTLSASRHYGTAAVTVLRQCHYPDRLLSSTASLLIEHQCTAGCRRTASSSSCCRRLTAWLIMTAWLTHAAALTEPAHVAPRAEYSQVAQYILHASTTASTGAPQSHNKVTTTA